jgi:hypothetical protein
MVLGWRRAWRKRLEQAVVESLAPGASASTIWGQILGTGKRRALMLKLTLRQIRRRSTSPTS